MKEFQITIAYKGVVQVTVKAENNSVAQSLAKDLIYSKPFGPQGKAFEPVASAYKIIGDLDLTDYVAYLDFNE